MKTLSVLAGLALGLSLVTAADACGDKLSAIGGGIRFERVYASRHPSRIVIYLPRDSQLRVANEELRLAETLTRAGHRVAVVDEFDSLPLHDAELILVDVADAGRIAAAGNTVATASVLPIAYSSGAAPTKVATTPAQCVARLSRRSGQHLLRAVDDVLDRRSRGLPSTCQPDQLLRGT